MAEDWARPVVRWEIEARDPVIIREFYAQLFNWAIEDGPVLFIPIGVGPPDGGPAGQIRAGKKSRVSLYIQVRDLRESLEKTKALGGTVVREPWDTSIGTTLAAISDPEGNAVTLVQQ